MNFIEFQASIERIRALIVGSQFQDFAVQDKDLLLLFYTHKAHVLRISLKTPPVLFFEHENFKLERQSAKIPMALFLGRHFLKKTVTDVKYSNDWGRRFEIHFDNEGQFWLDFTLVPGFQNVGLFASDEGKPKKVYWNKPRELLGVAKETTTEVSDFRSLEAIRDEWYGEIKTPNQEAPEKDWQTDVKKKIAKKTDAIEKIKNQGAENEFIVERLYAIGERLKYDAKLEAEDQFWLNSQQIKEANREQVFKKAKVLAAKKEGMAHRISMLEKEILDLAQSLDGPAPEPKHKISIAGKADVDTRKLEVDRNLSLYMGKNAKDNVQLLKSSQPWELWFHLKDYPSAYAITRRNKSVTVGHTELVKMASWFAKECLKNHKEKLVGHIEVIYAECRYVKLLKGDKLGRVSYTNAKTLRVSTA
jgi:hypothetical protein